MTRNAPQLSVPREETHGELAAAAAVAEVAEAEVSEAKVSEATAIAGPRNRIPKIRWSRKTAGMRSKAVSRSK
jgi:hypothetical protein